MGTVVRVRYDRCTALHLAGSCPYSYHPQNPRHLPLTLILTTLTLTLTLITASCGHAKVAAYLLHQVSDQDCMYGGV